MGSDTSKPREEGDVPQEGDTTRDNSPKESGAPPPDGAEKKEHDARGEDTNPPPNTDIEAAREALTEPTPWPNLFAESMDMLGISLIMYGLSDIRRLAKEGKLQPSTKDPNSLQRVIDLPCSAWDILEVYETNKETVRLATNEKEHQLYYEAMTRNQFLPGSENLSREESEREQKKVFCVAFADEKSEEECVWGIEVNHSCKRVTVAFRGSYTRLDFVKDAKAVMAEINVQNSTKLSLPPRVSVHMGFKDYLYRETSVGKVLKTVVTTIETMEDKTNHQTRKFRVILDMAATLCAENPGYRLYVTGHSLGGALATLLAFEAAASTDERFSKPVTCVSIASPRVGNLNFLRAVQTLEEKGMLRMLRLSNQMDAVPYLPPTGFAHILDALFCSHVLFRHAGVGLKLYDDYLCCAQYRPTFQISRPPKLGTWTSCIELLCYDLFNIFRHTVLLIMTCSLLACCCCKIVGNNVLREHSNTEYGRRLRRDKAKLKSLSLNDVYNKHVKRGLYDK